MGRQVYVEIENMDAMFPRAEDAFDTPGWVIYGRPVYSDLGDIFVFDCRCPIVSGNAWIRAALMRFSVPFVEG